jgi:hypothetical protein
VQLHVHKFYPPSFPNNLAIHQNYTGAPRYFEKPRSAREHELPSTKIQFMILPRYRSRPTVAGIEQRHAKAIDDPTEILYPTVLSIFCSTATTRGSRYAGMQCGYYATVFHESHDSGQNRLQHSKFQFIDSFRVWLLPACSRDSTGGA